MNPDQSTHGIAELERQLQTDERFLVDALLPFEAEAVARNRVELAIDLANAKEILNYGLRLPLKPFRDQCYMERACGVGQTLFIRCCWHYRAAIALTDLGNAPATDMMTRTLFETLLAMIFVMKPRVRLWTRQKDANGKLFRSPVNRFGKTLNRDFRTVLYLVYTDIQNHRWARDFLTVPGAKKAGKALSTSLDAERMAQWQRYIGQGWLDRLTARRSYSGLNIQQLSECLSEATRRWYKVVYAVHSSVVHGTDASNYVEPQEGGGIQPSWQSPSDTLRLSLQTAGRMFFAAVFSLHEFLDFGVDVTTRLQELKSKFEMTI